MSLKVITTVGTSLFTNYQKPENSEKLGNQFQSIGDLLDKLKKLGAIDIQNSRYKSTIRNLKERIKLIWLPEAKEKSCAEIQTLAAIAKEAEAKIEVILLATDTVLSVVACELIKEWLQENKVHEKKITCNDVKIIEGLQVSYPDTFKTKGLQNLIQTIRDLKVANTVLNVSGGYKAILPFLTLIGQLESIDLKYMYEDSNQLITIPKLPFSFDWGMLDTYAAFLFNTSLITGKKRTELEKLGIIEPGQSPITLTTLGELLKAYLNNNEVPFQATTFGYFVEYKLYEYYTKNNYLNYNKVELGKKLSDDPQQDLEDADLWMENEESKVVLAEIKPASIYPKSLRSKIKKLLGFVENYGISEFWIIIYEYEGNKQNNDLEWLEWCEKVVNEEIRYLYPQIVFKIKKITISKNAIDGNRNRILYHEFMREAITKEPEEIYPTSHP